MRVARGFLGPIVTALWLSTANAAGADELRAASLASTCAACHGTNGRAPPQSPVATLAAMQADRLRSEMLAFKRGERTGTVMPQLSKGYTDAQIDALATFFAAQPSPGTR